MEQLAQNEARQDFNCETAAHVRILSAKSPEAAEKNQDEDQQWNLQCAALEAMRLASGTTEFFAGVSSGVSY